MQGPVFSDKGAFGVAPASPAFPGSRRDQKEKKCTKETSLKCNPDSQALAQNQEGVCLLSACQVGKQLWMPKTL